MQEKMQKGKLKKTLSLLVAVAFAISSAVQAAPYRVPSDGYLRPTAAANTQISYEIKKSYIAANGDAKEDGSLDNDSSFTTAFGVKMQATDHTPKTVLINGYGVIGSKVAKALRKCGFRVVVSDISEESRDIALRDGFNIYPCAKEALSQEIVDVVVDATPPGEGMKMKKIYGGHAVIYQGGEALDIAEGNFHQHISNWDEISTKKQIRVVTCNTSAMFNIFVPLLEEFNGLNINIEIENVPEHKPDSYKGIEHQAANRHQIRFLKLLPDDLKKNLSQINTTVVTDPNLRHYHMHRAIVSAPNLTADKVKEILAAQNTIALIESRKERYEAKGEAERIYNLISPIAEHPMVVIVQVLPTANKNEIEIDYAVPHQSNVIPDNINALYAILGLLDKDNSQKTVNEILRLDEIKAKIEATNFSHHSSLSENEDCLDSNGSDDATFGDASSEDKNTTSLPQIIKNLTDVLKDKNASDFKKGRAVEILGGVGLGLPEVIETLEKLRSESTGNLKTAADKALVDIREKSRFIALQAPSAQELSKKLSEDVKDSTSELASFVILTDQEGKVLFASVPYIFTEYLQLSRKEVDPMPGVRPGPYSGIHGWELAMLRRDYNEETEVLQLTGVIGDDGKLIADKEVSIEGEAVLQTVCPAGSQFRGTLKGTPELPDGFIRLDEPASQEGFLSRKLNQAIKVITDELKAQYEEILTAEFVNSILFLAQCINPQKELILKDSLKEIFQRQGYPLAKSLTISQFVEIVSQTKAKSTKKPKSVAPGRTKPTPTQEILTKTHARYPITITNPLGLHLRIATVIVDLVQKSKSTVTLTRGNQTANAKSLEELIKFAAEEGDTVVVETKGNDAMDVAVKIEEILKDESLLGNIGSGIKSSSAGGINSQIESLLTGLYSLETEVSSEAAADLIVLFFTDDTAKAILSQKFGAYGLCENILRAFVKVDSGKWEEVLSLRENAVIALLLATADRKLDMRRNATITLEAIFKEIGHDLTIKILTGLLDHNDEDVKSLAEYNLRIENAKSSSAGESLQNTVALISSGGIFKEQRIAIAINGAA